jgi:hypothetical protein
MEKGAWFRVIEDDKTKVERNERMRIKHFYSVKDVHSLSDTGSA